MSESEAARHVVAIPLSPLAPHATLTAEVVTVLRARILSGYFQSGQQLVQAEVARQLGVSRGPVREALNQLMAEGLVREEPRKGTFVTRPEAEDVRDALDVRLALEMRAAQLVIARREPETVKALRGALDALVAAIKDGESSAIGAADLGFHETLCRMSGNRLLHSLFANQAKTVIVLLQVDELSYSSMPEALIAEHEALFDCIAKGDAARMQTLLTTHIEDARDRLLSQMHRGAGRVSSPGTGAAATVGGVPRDDSRATS